jgi:HEAT repeat protein
LRKAAVAALGEIAHPDCMPLVDIALNDNDPDVRKLARWAKDQIEASMTVAGE